MASLGAVSGGLWGGLLAGKSSQMVFASAPYLGATEVLA